MICPDCGIDGESKIVDVRPISMSNSIRRRRECLYCGKRFTTYEIPSNSKLRSLIKLAGRRMEFNLLSEL